MEWTIEEEKLLHNEVLKYSIENVDWQKISGAILQRTDDECKDHWEAFKERGIIRGGWCTQEDEIIIKAVREGVQKWSDVSELLWGLRTGKQCRERWLNHLDPKLKKNVPWTDLEDQQLVNFQQLYGNAWTRIARRIQGRSENEVKNRWYSVHLKKKSVIYNNSGLTTSKEGQSTTIGNKRKLGSPSPSIGKPADEAESSHQPLSATLETSSSMASLYGAQDYQDLLEGKLLSELSESLLIAEVEVQKIVQEEYQITDEDHQQFIETITKQQQQSINKVCNTSGKNAFPSLSHRLSVADPTMVTVSLAYLDIADHYIRTLFHNCSQQENLPPDSPFHRKKQKRTTFPSEDERCDDGKECDNPRKSNMPLSFSKTKTQTARLSNESFENMLFRRLFFPDVSSCSSSSSSITHPSEPNKVTSTSSATPMRTRIPCKQPKVISPSRITEQTNMDGENTTRTPEMSSPSSSPTINELEKLQMNENHSFQKEPRLLDDSSNFESQFPSGLSTSSSQQMLLLQGIASQSTSPLWIGYAMTSAPGSPK